MSKKIFTIYKDFSCNYRKYDNSKCFSRSSLNNKHGELSYDKNDNFSFKDPKLSNTSPLSNISLKNMFTIIPNKPVSSFIPTSPLNTNYPNLIKNLSNNSSKYMCYSDSIVYKRSPVNINSNISQEKESLNLSQNNKRELWTPEEDNLLISLLIQEVNKTLNIRSIYTNVVYKNSIKEKGKSIKFNSLIEKNEDSKASNIDVVLSAKNSKKQLEASILKNINANTLNWNLIADRMNEISLAKRQGKQLKERYINHLDPSVVKDYWSEEEENILIKMQKELGNAWNTISRYLPGRTDNAIKNYFYSKLRRHVRYLVKIMSKNEMFKQNNIDENVYDAIKIYNIVKNSKISIQDVSKIKIVDLINEDLKDSDHDKSKSKKLKKKLSLKDFSGKSNKLSYEYDCDTNKKETNQETIFTNVINSQELFNLLLKYRKAIKSIEESKEELEYELVMENDRKTVKKNSNELELEDALEKSIALTLSKTTSDNDSQRKSSRLASKEPRIFTSKAKKIVENSDKPNKTEILINRISKNQKFIEGINDIKIIIKKIKFPSSITSASLSSKQKGNFFTTFKKETEKSPISESLNSFQEKENQDTSMNHKNSFLKKKKKKNLSLNQSLFDDNNFVNNFNLETDIHTKHLHNIFNNTTNNNFPVILNINYENVHMTNNFHFPFNNQQLDFNNIISQTFGYHSNKNSVWNENINTHNQGETIVSKSSVEHKNERLDLTSKNMSNDFFFKNNDNFYLKYVTPKNNEKDGFDNIYSPLNGNSHANDIFSTMSINQKNLDFGNCNFLDLDEKKHDEAKNEYLNDTNIIRLNSVNSLEGKDEVLNKKGEALDRKSHSHIVLNANLLNNSLNTTSTNINEKMNKTTIPRLIISEEMNANIK